jgi:hypothetical protein
VGDDDGIKVGFIVGNKEGYVVGISDGLFEGSIVVVNSVENVDIVIAGISVLGIPEVEIRDCNNV